MPYIVILNNDPATRSWTIVDAFFPTCPPTPVIYTNVRNFPYTAITHDCGQVDAQFGPTGSITHARAVRI